MIRDAKIFYLINKDYSPIKDVVELSSDSYYMCESIGIWSYSNTFSDSYIVLSIDPKIDKIIEDNGGIEVQTNDPFKLKLKEEGIQNRQFFFGKEDLIDFLT